MTDHGLGPAQILADLVDQLDGIGIPEWGGAEGLALEDARSFLATGAAEPVVGWDEPDFPYSAWQKDVAEGNTRRSYAQWVLYQRANKD